GEERREQHPPASEANRQKRRATPSKAKLGWLLTAFVGASMVFSAAQLSFKALENMQHRALSSAEAARPTVVKAPAAQKVRPPPQASPRKAIPPGVLKAVALEVLILMLAVFLLSLGSAELARPDWDVAW